MAAPNSYNFTLVLNPRDPQAGGVPVDDDLLDRFFEAGCDDAVLSYRGKEILAEFDREAWSFSDAVTSAISHAESADTSRWVTRVEPDDLVTMSEIAQRTGRSKQSIAQLVAGQRGPKTFPPHLGYITSRTKVWRWSDVSKWFSKELGEPVSLDGAPEFAAVLNGALEIRRQLMGISLLASDHDSNGERASIEVSREALAQVPALVDEMAAALSPRLASSKS